MSQESSLLPPWASREYWFPSEGERDHFASQYGEFIIKMLKSKNWDEFDSRDAVVRMARAYIKEMYEDPYYDVPAPRLHDPATLTEAHFVFWAHTSSGRQEVEKWRDLRGIVYKAFAAPRFLREILTRGTRLHSEWSSGGVRLTAAQDLATTMLRSETPALEMTEMDISGCIWEFYSSRFREISDKIDEYVSKVQFNFDHDVDEYIFSVEREEHLKEFPYGLQGVEMPMGNFWKLPYCHEFFAFGATGEANRAMMMGVFHRNKFIVHDD